MGLKAGRGNVLDELTLGMLSLLNPSDSNLSRISQAKAGTPLILELALQLLESLLSVYYHRLPWV